MTTTYDAGPAGWVRVTYDEGTAWVRFRDDGGRLVPAQVLLDPVAQVVTVNTFKRLLLGRAEAWANGQGAANLRTKIDDAGPDLTAALDQAVPRPSSAPRGRGQGRGRKHLGTFSVPVLDVPAEPPAGGYGDDFYRGVAAVYTDAATKGERPVWAIQIAAAGGLPIYSVGEGEDEGEALARVLTKRSTVNRWVREARRRGFLAPGRVGKVG